MHMFNNFKCKLYNNIENVYAELETSYISNRIKKFLFENCYTLCVNYPDDICKFFIFDHVNNICFFDNGYALYQPDNSRIYKNVTYCYKIQLAPEESVHIANELTIQSTQHNESVISDNTIQINIMCSLLTMLLCIVMIFFYFMGLGFSLYDIYKKVPDEKHIIIGVPV